DAWPARCPRRSSDCSRGPRSAPVCRSRSPSSLSAASSLRRRRIVAKPVSRRKPCRIDNVDPAPHTRPFMTQDSPAIRTLLQTPLGVGLCAREQTLVAQSLEQVFGLQLIQVGAWGPPELFLEHARTTRHMLVDPLPGPGVALRCDPSQLGVGPGSVDVL